MLPKDIRNLIDTYNEAGVFFVFGSKLWWFNSKRIEEWCFSDGISEVQLKNGKLFGTGEFCQYYCLIGSEFRAIDCIPSWESGRICTNPKTGFWYDYNDWRGNFYLRSEGSSKILKRKQICTKGFGIILIGSFIYYFGRWISERFDIVKNEWSFIARTPNFIETIIFIGSTIYILFDNGQLSIYDEKLDLLLYTKFNLYSFGKLSLVSRNKSDCG